MDVHAPACRREHRLPGAFRKAAGCCEARVPCAAVMQASHSQFDLSASGCSRDFHRSYKEQVESRSRRERSGGLALGEREPRETARTPGEGDA